MRFRLRTLLIVLAIGPIALWIGYVGYSAVLRYFAQRDAATILRLDH
jgi:hypothetical protein